MNNYSISFFLFFFFLKIIIDFFVFVITVDWCPEPPEVNGGIVSTTGKRAGSTASYTCQNGFILFGDNVSILIINEIKLKNNRIYNI